MRVAPTTTCSRTSRSVVSCDPAGGAGGQSWWAAGASDGQLMGEDASFASALQRAKAALDLRRPDEAVRHLDRALAVAPHDDRLWCLRAQAMLQLEHPSDALEAARQAAALDPTEEWSR